MHAGGHRLVEAHNAASFDGAPGWSADEQGAVLPSLARAPQSRPNQGDAAAGSSHQSGGASNPAV